ncbi:hypothetical protein BLA29_001518 [Euroglyphus maynei]|uniref:PHD-type domain-containing protein n=1 Tax=Euroglyphus maynei TaxID=6958 RepID=A0A1Y3B2H2_EURMA|nr:hypothetical protein BLA29_001518 [Euroglyphus maynei]
MDDSNDLNYNNANNNQNANLMSTEDDDENVNERNIGDEESFDNEMHNDDNVEDDDGDDDDDDEDDDDGDSVCSENDLPLMTDDDALGISTNSVVIDSNENPASSQSTSTVTSCQTTQIHESDENVKTNDFKSEETTSPTTSTAMTTETLTKRTSGRLRKDGKVPMHAKNLFPGRPGRNNRPKRKFAQNLILNFSDSSTTMIKSEPASNPEEILVQKPQQQEQKSILSSSSTSVESTPNEPNITDTCEMMVSNPLDSVPVGDSELSSLELIPETSITAESSIISFTSPSIDNDPSMNLVETASADLNAEDKIATAKKKINISGKIKGKLSGNRRNKTIEYRKKRGPKGKFKTFSTVGLSSSPYASLSFFNGSAASGGGGGYQSTNTTASSNLTNVMTAIDNSQDDSGIENKIILCSSKDNYLLSQDVCVNCGSLGQGDEGRLISCAQCGQCYHLFCAQDNQPTKVTKTMLNKGWRCLECTVCEGCGKATDDSRLLLCDDCDISYHTYCLDPPLEEVPQGTWKCQWCAICTNCRATSPGYRSQWQENYTLCGPCASQKKCSSCKSNYDENDLIIQCIQCQR